MMVKGQQGLADAEAAGIKAYLIRANTDGSFTTRMNPSMDEYLKKNRI